MAQPTKWDDDFDKKYYTNEEIVDSDDRVDAIQREIENGHNGLLAFERIAVDA